MPDPIVVDPAQASENPQIDVAKIQADAEAKAEAAANAKVEKLKEDLAQSLTGKPAASAPKSWDEIYQKSGQTAEARAEALVTAKFEERDKAQKQQQDKTLEQQAETQRAEWATVSREWSEAVADGILPDLGAEVKAKLKAGTKVEDLTAEEQADPGLKAYNEAVLLHAKLKNEGKSNSFYRTASKFYNKQPAGVSAPVIGGGTPTSAQGKDASYEEIQANRKRIFGF